MKVKIKQWNGVASWLWVANDENCGICRMSFNGCCPDCKVPGDDCPLVWGQCSHCFHMHCILKWLNSQQVQQQCPMCRQEWKFKEWRNLRDITLGFAFQRLKNISGLGDLFIFLEYAYIAYIFMFFLYHLCIDDVWRLLRMWIYINIDK